LAALLAVLLLVASARAATLDFSNDDTVPPVVTDTTRPRKCTIAYLVTDVATNDVYVSRMEVDSAPDANPTRGRYPCPTNVPARVATRAMESCLVRAGDSRYCVFGDMARGFENRPDARLTAENTSRCASDLYSYIGIACWKAGERNICDVACGGTEQEAKDMARGRCEVKQQQRCGVTGAAPILPPQ
jgi:hypothetical protein